MKYFTLNFLLIVILLIVTGVPQSDPKIAPDGSLDRIPERKPGFPVSIITLFYRRIIVFFKPKQFGN
uniref:5 kDa salivary protein n=1 Tax=Phlebotomus orientalis TaxID=99786 RepID=V5K5J1_PHLOR|nr:5 kDa salivary protein [Phlebotomus orientalis]